MTTNTAMRIPPVEPSLPPVISPDRVPLKEPVINWTELSSPVESTANKACRIFGQCLMILSVFSGVGRYLAATHMTASPDTIINTCYALRVVMVVSAVAGVVLWFFNRLTVDPNALLEERGKVKDQMGTGCLADLRQKHNFFVVSNPELNQWVRYLVQKSPYDEFIGVQSERVFDLDLEDETVELLKTRYLAYAQDPATEMSFKKLIGERPLHFLLTMVEQADLKRLVASREVSKLKILNAASYLLFIDRNGIEVLEYLDPAQRKNLVPAFRDHALQSGMGILQLQRDRAAELNVFGDPTTLFQEMATGEGRQPYETFKARNGVEAVSLITNPAVKEALWHNFFAHVVSKGHGLVKTREIFGEDIVQFGELASQGIYSQVLTNEIEALSREERTYAEFRKRNGIDVIQFNGFQNPNLAGLFTACFLKLSPAELINPAYALDRQLFGLTNADICSVLERRWNGMTFANVLATDKEAFIASVTGENRYFDPKGWTLKAVQETSRLRIQEIIATYRVLFTMGVLTAGDGNFSARLFIEVQSITEWTTFVDSYGTFVFENGLLQSSQVQNLTHRFVHEHAESFLQGSFDAGMIKYAQVIQQFCIDQTLARKIDEAKAAIAAENQRYDGWLKHHEDSYAQRVQALNEETDRFIASLESDYKLPQKERLKNAAHQQWLEKKAAYEALAERKDADDQKLKKVEEEIEEKEARYDELLAKRQTVSGLNVFWNLAQYEQKVQQATTVLKTAEDFVKGRCADQEAALEALQSQEKELQAKIQNIEKLQGELAQLAEKIQAPAFVERKAALEKRIKNPDLPVTGLEAAKKAKEEAAQAPRLLAAVKAEERRLAELKNLLNQQDHQLEPFRSKLAHITQQIAEKRKETSQIRSTAEAQVQLPRCRQEKRQASEAAGQWKAMAIELLSLPQQINTLSKGVEHLRSDRDRKIGARDEKNLQLEETLQLCRAAEATKRTTELSYNVITQKLAEQTTQARQKCAQDLTAILSEKDQVGKQAELTHTRAVGQIILNFKQQF